MLSRSIASGAGCPSQVVSAKVDRSLPRTTVTAGFRHVGFFEKRLVDDAAFDPRPARRDFVELVAEDLPVEREVAALDDERLRVFVASASRCFRVRVRVRVLGDGASFFGFFTPRTRDGEAMRPVDFAFSSGASTCFAAPGLSLEPAHAFCDPHTATNAPHRASENECLMLTSHYTHVLHMHTNERGPTFWPRAIRPPGTRRAL